MEIKIRKLTELSKHEIILLEMSPSTLKALVTLSWIGLKRGRISIELIRANKILEIIDIPEDTANEILDAIRSNNKLEEE